VVLIVVLIMVALATAALVPLAQGQSVNWSNFLNSYDWLVATVIIILVIALGLYATHQTLGYPEGRRERRRRRREGYEPSGATPGPDAAIEIARERYARGEITSQQLSQLLDQLGANRGPPASR